MVTRKTCADAITAAHDPPATSLWLIAALQRFDSRAPIARASSSHSSQRPAPLAWARGELGRGLEVWCCTGLRRDLGQHVETRLAVWNRARREWSGGAKQKYAVWLKLKTGSDDWIALHVGVTARANTARSQKAKARPRKPDGTLTSQHTNGVRTGSKGSTNAGAKAKATAAGVDRGTVEKVEAISACTDQGILSRRRDNSTAAARHHPPDRVPGPCIQATT